MFLPNKVIESVIRLAPGTDKDTICNTLMCLKFTVEWMAEIVAIINDSDKRGWEAFQTAKTTASTLLYISQQSQLRTDALHNMSPPDSPTPSDISEPYHFNTEITTEIKTPVVVFRPSAPEPLPPLARTHNTQTSCTIQKRKQDEQPKSVKATAVMPSGHAGGSLERPKRLRQTKKE